jgi:RNA polymerase sigma-70 factor (ECF subfamily)
LKGLFVYSPSLIQFIRQLKESLNHIRLFHSLAKGDELAFEKLYKLYFPRLHSFSFKIINDSGLAKDVVQNVFIKIWETRTSFNFDNPEAFIYRMVRNASINYIRHLKVVDNLKSRVKDQYLGEELYYIDMVGNEPYILIEKELEDKILEVMNSLPDKCLTVFRMSRIDGLKNREIADQLEISIKSVEKHISKAMQIYRGNFADYLPLHIILLVLGGMK